MILDFGSDIRLSGRLDLPDSENSKYPTVLILPGSGEFDVDGNVTEIPELDTYRLLAQEFNSIGYATFRYNKRGIEESEGNYYSAGVEEFLTDAEEAYNFLLTLDEVDKDNIYVCGHSEGAILATILQDRKQLFKGMMLLSGGGLDLRTGQLRLYEYLDWEKKQIGGIAGLVARFTIRSSKYIKKQEELYDECRTRNVDFYEIDGKIVPVKWYREHLEYTPEMINEMLSRVDVPILALFGTKDIQSKEEDITSNNEQIETDTLEGMDHMLRRYPDIPSVIGQLGQYRIDQGLHLHDELTPRIKRWLLLHNK